MNGMATRKARYRVRKAAPLSIERTSSAVRSLYPLPGERASPCQVFKEGADQFYMVLATGRRWYCVPVSLYGRVGSVRGEQSSERSGPCVALTSQASGRYRLKWTYCRWRPRVDLGVHCAIIGRAGCAPGARSARFRWIGNPAGAGCICVPHVFKQHSPLFSEYAERPSGSPMASRGLSFRR